MGRMRRDTWDLGTTFSGSFGISYLIQVRCVTIPCRMLQKKGIFLSFVLLYCLLQKKDAYFSVCKKKLFRSIDDVLRSNVLCLRCVLSQCVCVCVWRVCGCVCAYRFDLQPDGHCIPLAVAWTTEDRCVTYNGLYCGIREYGNVQSTH